MFGVNFQLDWDSEMSPILSPKRPGQKGKTSSYSGVVPSTTLGEVTRLGSRLFLCCEMTSERANNVGDGWNEKEQQQIMESDCNIF